MPVFGHRFNKQIQIFTTKFNYSQHNYTYNSNSPWDTQVKMVTEILWQPTKQQITKLVHRGKHWCNYQSSCNMVIKYLQRNLPCNMVINLQRNLPCNMVINYLQRNLPTKCPENKLKYSDRFSTKSKNIKCNIKSEINPVLLHLYK